MEYERRKGKLIEKKKISQLLSRKKMKFWIINKFIRSK